MGLWKEDLVFKVYFHNHYWNIPQGRLYFSSTEKFKTHKCIRYRTKVGYFQGKDHHLVVSKERWRAPARLPVILNNLNSRNPRERNTFNVVSRLKNDVASWNLYEIMKFSWYREIARAALMCKSGFLKGGERDTYRARLIGDEANVLDGRPHPDELSETPAAGEKHTRI